MNLPLYLLSAVFGAMVGSFFNVIIYRMPRGESVVWPPSRCTRCGRGIRFYENLPIVSWLALRGKCRSCKAPISAEYPLVEAFTGLTAALVTAMLLHIVPDAPLDFKIAFAFLVLGSIPICIIDFRHFLIPDVVTLPGIALGLGLSFMRGGQSPWASLIGAAGAGGLLWLVGFAASKILKKDAMGFGDVKLIAMAGALFGLKTAMVGLLLASVFGCIVGIPMLLFKRLNEHNHIPFGPYICFGVAASALYGSDLLAWYFGLLQ